jgi:hypothetical protein
VSVGITAIGERAAGLARFDARILAEAIRLTAPALGLGAVRITAALRGTVNTLVTDADLALRALFLLPPLLSAALFLLVSLGVHLGQAEKRNESPGQGEPGQGTGHAATGWRGGEGPDEMGEVDGVHGAIPFCRWHAVAAHVHA